MNLDLYVSNNVFRCVIRYTTVLFNKFVMYAICG